MTRYPLTWEQSVEWLRAQPDKRDLVLSSYYDDPLLEAARRYHRSLEWATIARFLPASGRALDVGAGRGIASFALAQHGLNVTALEPDRSSLVGSTAIRGLVLETGLPIEVIESASERLPFADRTFDVVFGRAVLHHVTDLRGACSEFLRVLKPGGKLIAIREHVLSRPEDLDAFLTVHPLHSLYGGEKAFVLRHYLNSIRAPGFELDAVLLPLASPINLAPHTPQSMQSEIAHRAARGNRAIELAISGLLALPGVWALTSRALSIVDHRPGRLYSFIAHRRSA